MRTTRVLSFNDVRDFIDGVFDGELHAKRVLSLANASLGVRKTASLAGTSDERELFKSPALDCAPPAGDVGTSGTL